MKRTLLTYLPILAASILAAALTACHSSKVGEEFTGGPGAAEGATVDLTLDMYFLGSDYTRAEAVLPAEQINSLRVVIVDLGIDSQGNPVAEPAVERNDLFEHVSLTTGSDVGLPTGVARLQFPKIRADRRKKIYLIANAEPAKQSYLQLQLPDGTQLNSLSIDNNHLFVPDSNGSADIDDATFVSPKGSYTNNDIPANEEMSVPMTAVHTIAIPTIAELTERYPSINNSITYTLPGKLYVVRAVNKISFEFRNMTCSDEDEQDGIELLVREWSISEINNGGSYLFGHPGDNGNLYADKETDYYYNVNAPWMQWLYDEAERSLSSFYTPAWLTDYELPSNAQSGEYTFRPGNYTGSADQGSPSDSDGYLLPAPATTAGTTLSTEKRPVYFGESHSGNPQQYELTFTVWQRTKQQPAWNNPYTYRATSTADVSGSFNLKSLFRNTHVVVTVTFRTGRGRINAEVDVHPYGSYELEPDFGL